jgi:hypothetical protein
LVVKENEKTKEKRKKDLRKKCILPPLVDDREQIFNRKFDVNEFDSGLK